MECKCNKLECSKCLVEVSIIETSTCYIPRAKYEKLQEAYGVLKLFHVEENLIELANKVKRASEEVVVTRIEIEDGES